MADNQTGRITNFHEGVDRFNNPYVKLIRYSNGEDMIRHNVEMKSLWTSLNRHASDFQTGLNSEEQRMAFRATSTAILVKVARHTREWGVARLPTNIREPVHELEDAIERNRTDFGPDVGVTQGAPYNGTGY